MQRPLGALVLALALAVTALGPALAQEAPSRPENVEATAGDREVELSWDPSTGDGPITYRVELSTDQSTWTLVEETTATALTVTGLTNGVEYAFRVRAQGPGGVSAWSEIVTAVPEGPAEERANVLNWIRDVDWSVYAETTPRLIASASDHTGALRTRRELQRASQGTNQWWDTCNDVTTRPATWMQEGPFLEGWEQPGPAASSRLDLRSTTIVQVGDQTGFLGYSCQQWASPDLGDGAMVWALYTNPKADGPPFLAVVFQDRGRLVAMIIRTVSPDPDTWFLTWIAEAQRLDEYAVDFVVPSKAFGNVPDFQFEWAVIDGAGREDLFPERYVPRRWVRPETGEGERERRSTHTGIPTYPNPCTPTSSYVGQASATWAPPAPKGHPDSGWAVAGVNTGQLTGGVRVALIDDGVAPRPGLGGPRVLRGYDAVFEQDLPAGGDSDRGGHGTAVAGLMASASDGGITGLNTGVDIVPIRVVDANQCTNEHALGDGVWAAIGLAAQMNQSSVPQDRWLRAVVIPLGGPLPSNIDDGLRDALDVAQAVGLTVIAAAGNTGADVLYPAGQWGVIAVGSVTRDGTVAAYSPSHRAVDVVAPGGDRSGSTAGDILTFWELNQLRPQFGTGLSAALVGGAVAAYRARYPEASPGAVRSALEQSARDEGQPGHDYDYGYGVLDVTRFLQTPPGFDPATGQLSRINETHPTGAAVQISRQRFPQAGARHVVLARHDVFADALAGSPLTGQGPLLLSGQSVIPEETEPELRRVLAPGRKVYLLGGFGAIGPEVEARVRELGYVPHRLAGASRVETAVAIGNEVRALYPGRQTVVLARGFGQTPTDTAAWADAVTVGGWAAATRTPVLLTATERLHPSTGAALRGWNTQRTVLLGGAAALSGAVEAAVPGPMRVAGAERAGTAVQVAQTLWQQPASYLVVNGYTTAGWAFGLSAAGLAADRSAALLLTDQRGLPPATHAFVEQRCPGVGALTLVGSDQLVGGSVEALLAELATC